MFVGDGELASRMRGVDWSGTPLGHTESWPQSLRAVVRMMLASRYQMWMGWGSELTFLYNDAYRPTMGVKHPAGLATPAASVWREVWGELGPLVDHVMRTGAATYNEGMLLLLERSGYPEETYHTFSYSPLFDDGGAIAGLFCVVVEESDRVINDRRLATLRGLASGAAATNTETELFHAVGETLGANPWDLPFTLCYLLEGEGDAARLVSATGVPPGSPSAPARLREGADAWTWSRSLPAEPLVLSDLDGFKDLPRGAWDVPPRQIIITPIAQQGLERSAAGFIVAGVNPYRPLDPGYRGFVELLAGQIGAALANVRAYEAERRRAEALAEIDRAKTTFFSNVSHEFRTPLTLMLGPLEEVLADQGGVAGPNRARLELAHRNGARLQRLVNSLLDFSRIEAGRANAAYEATDLAARSAEIASTFRAAVEAAGMELRLACEPIGEPVYIDPDMWETILLNLLSNAFKFTEAGHVGVATGRSRYGRHAEVRVFDTGVGVPAEDLPRLFERFHRVDRGQTGGFQGRSIEGSGIGLALVQELVKLHGGSIRVDSAVGEGTSFTLSLPLGLGHLDPARVRAGSRTLGAVDARGFIEDALRWTPTRGSGHDPPRDLAPLPRRPPFGPS